MVDKILNILLVAVYTAIVVLATVFCMKLSQIDRMQSDSRDSSIRSSMHALNTHRYFLDITMGDYVAVPADSALIEYGTKVVQNLEEIITLSPFVEIRDSARVIQTEYIRRFPMLDAAAMKMDIRNGDLILRHNNSLHSELFRKIGVREQKYSHLGIIYRTPADTLLVLHSQANDYTGVGGIEASPLYSFMPRGDFDVAIYRLKEPQAVRDAWVDEILRLREKGVPFDPAFNIVDTCKLYCAEMVAYSLNRIIGREAIAPHGFFMGKKVYAVDDCYLIPEMERIYHRERAEVYRPGE